MASNPKPISILLLLSLLYLSTLSSFAISTSSDPQSVYELLTKFGLPSGLLPDSVKSYSLSSDEGGSFVVELSKPCYIHFEYLVYYDKKITGKLEYGSISDLKGIQVQKLFLWLSVDQIKIDSPPSDSIYFQVGIVNKKLGVDQFKTVHSCGKKVTSDEIFQLSAPVDDIPMLITD